MVYGALRLAQTYVTDAVDAATVANALMVLQRRRETCIVVQQTPAGDWMAWLQGADTIVSRGRNHGEAIGLLHGLYSMLQEDAWPGLRLELLPQLPLPEEVER